MASVVKLRNLETQHSNLRLSFHSMNRKEKGVTAVLLLGGIPLAIGIIALLSHLHVTQLNIPHVNYVGSIGLTAAGGVGFAGGLLAAAGFGIRHERFKKNALEENLNEENIGNIRGAVSNKAYAAALSEKNFEIRVSDKGILVLLDIYHERCMKTSKADERTNVNDFLET